MELNSELMDAVAQALTKAGYFANKSDFDKLAKQVLNDKKSLEAAEKFSITKAIRGECAKLGRVLNQATKAEDMEYAQRTLVPDSGQGANLVPTIQADAIIAILQAAAVLRASGATVWPMANIEKLNIPSETAVPTVSYGAVGASITPSDPGIGQVALSLKSRQALTQIPNELLRVSVPAVDAIVTRLIGKAFAKHEDTAFFGASQLSGGPVNLLGASGITTINQAGSTLAFSDLLAVMAQSAQAEAVGPFVWFMSPQIFFERVLGLADSQNRPLITTANPITDGKVGSEVTHFKMFGEDVYVTPRIPNTLGASSNQSYICRTNPEYLHIGDSGTIGMAVSTEFYFDRNSIAVRGVHRHDFGYGPAAGIVVLENVK